MATNVRGILTYSDEEIAGAAIDKRADGDGVSLDTCRVWVRR